MFSLAVLQTLLVPLSLLSASGSTAADFPFRDVSLPWVTRMQDLMDRLTVDEVLEQLANPGYNPTPPIQRLGIGSYNFATECLRGDAVAPGNATAFPQAIGLAATWSPDLMYRVAEATSVEARAKNNYFRQQGNFGAYTSTSCFSPVVNIVRDYRWGRIQETYGEDPYLTGRIATAFVQGLQGDHPRYVRASAGCKHLAAYDGPENIPVDRHTFNAKVSERDLRMTYLPAFKTCVEAGTYSIGGSYNAINGIPSALQRYLMTDILRGEWGFQGYIFSDAGAVESVMSSFNWTQSKVDAAALCLNAGTNVDLTNDGNTIVYAALGDALKQNKVTEAILRERLAPLFYTRMRLGEFDPPEMNPYRSLGMEEVESAAHRALAVEAAMKSFVLLKNNGVLPLKARRYDTIGVVGPMANNSEQLFGDYHPNPAPDAVVTPLQGLQSLATTVRYAAGCDGNPSSTQCESYSSDTVKNAVTNTQLNIVTLGTGQAVEAEGNDRTSIDLPGHQAQLLMDVIKYGGSTPLIVLLFSGGPLNISFMDSDPSVSAILHCFLPAQATGDAIRHAILNDVTGAVPAGRSPYTWPVYFEQLNDMTDYSMEGRTYRYWAGPALYPFGYGLSYSTFAYSKLMCPKNISVGDGINCTVDIVNNGPIPADEVLQVYISWTASQTDFPLPRQQLVYFNRIPFKAKQQMTYAFHVDGRSLALWYDSGWEIKPGSVTVYAGGQQPNQQKQVPSNIVTAGVGVIAASA
ncbi:uncharacterized protein [Littorina saxatilis]|uniref:Fibronectin type III-like domain-containing protein n=1 Tax=Littorina saxatilis TaxID=31220 RepID=A0AAN9BKS3_9CAEN